MRGARVRAGPRPPAAVPETAKTPLAVPPASPTDEPATASPPPPEPEVLKVISATTSLIVDSFAGLDIDAIKADLRAGISEAAGGA